MKPAILCILHNQNLSLAFRRMLVKSYGLFFLGVRLAKEFVGVELMPALGPA